MTANEVLHVAECCYGDRKVTLHARTNGRGDCHTLEIASGTYEQVVDVGQCADVATLGTMLALLVQAFDREAPSA